MSLQQSYLNVRTRQEGFMEVLMYLVDTSVHIANVTASDILSYSNLDAITDIKKYTSDTIATLEENEWLLNGRFNNIVDGTTVDGYISNSLSSDTRAFDINPRLTVNLTEVSHIGNFSVLLNPAVPSGYPNAVKVTCYNNNTELGSFTISTVNVETLPSIVFDINLDNVSKLEIEFIGTKYPNKRIRVSNILFGKVMYLNQDLITKYDFFDKTSYVPDTLPSRTLSLTVNNYTGLFDVDNPANEYIQVDKNTRVIFRNGYNIAGYETDENGNLIYDDQNYPIVNNEDHLINIAWDDWKELRLVDVLTEADESTTFEFGSALDIMTDIYTNEYYEGEDRTVGQLVDNILMFEGLDNSTVEWSSDGIIVPVLAGGNDTDTLYRDYVINTVLPELPCRELIQLLAFSVGATILIKDNGKIKFANLNINDPNSFTHNFEFSYRDFESIPVAEKLETVSNLVDISVPKYNAHLNTDEGVKDITTVDVTSINAEITYNECQPTGISLAEDDTSGATIQNSVLFAHRGIVRLGGLLAGDTAKLVVHGYPITVQQTQERNVTSNTLVLDTQLIKNDPSSYNADGTIKQTEMIKRKYLEWYKKKFKYTIKTRGEPLVNAGDYAVIQTQFSNSMPVYILENHVTFDGTWSGDMEVIALGN